MPELQKALGKLNFDQSKERFNSLKEAKMVWKNNPETIVSWSAMSGTIIAIAVSNISPIRAEETSKKIICKTKFKGGCK